MRYAAIVGNTEGMMCSLHGAVYSDVMWKMHLLLEQKLQWNDLLKVLQDKT